MTSVSCISLTRSFRRHWWSKSFNTAVNQVDLEIPSGSAFALVGPNGAGKTTLMLMAIGLMRTTSGQALLDGQPAHTPEARYTTGFVPEKFQLPSTLTGREFLHLHAGLAQIPPLKVESRIDEIGELIDLSDRLDDRIREYSKGMQQRIAIGQALLAKPSLLMLDEPTSALDPLQRIRLRDTLRKVHQDGCTVVLNSHNLAEVEDICDYVAILDHGRIAASGLMRELAERSMNIRVRVRGWNDQLATALAQKVTMQDSTSLPNHDDMTFTITVSGDDDTAWVAHTIIESGAALLELSPSTSSLEELFIRTVKDQGSST